MSGRGVIFVREGRRVTSREGVLTEDLEEVLLMDRGSCLMVCIVSCLSRPDSLAVTRVTSDSFKLSDCLSLAEHSLSADKSADSVA